MAIEFKDVLDSTDVDANVTNAVKRQGGLEISDTTGLQAELDGKSDTDHTHTVSDVTGLQDELDSKLDNGDAYLKTEHIVSSDGSEDASKPVVTDGTGRLHGSLIPQEYYKLDGSQAITAPFAGGDQQFKSAADGTDPQDLVTKAQLDGKENALGSPSADGYVLSSLTDGTRSWVPMDSSGGSETFIGLTDTPNDYTDDGGKVVAVKSDETGLEFVDESWVKKTGDTMTGTLNFLGAEGINFRWESPDFYSELRADKTKGTALELHVRDKSDNSFVNTPLRIDIASAVPQLRGKSGIWTIDNNMIWHAGNMGSGSGLDADTLDGMQPSDLPISDDTQSALDSKLEVVPNATDTVVGGIKIRLDSANSTVYITTTGETP